MGNVINLITVYANRTQFFYARNFWKKIVLDYDEKFINIIGPAYTNIHLPPQDFIFLALEKLKSLA